jgi:hypothetical protein
MPECDQQHRECSGQLHESVGADLSRGRAEAPRALFERPHAQFDVAVCHAADVCVRGTYSVEFLASSSLGS